MPPPLKGGGGLFVLIFCYKKISMKTPLPLENSNFTIYYINLINFDKTSVDIH